MKIVKKFMKKQLSECLKEEKMYLIKEGELCCGSMAQISVDATVKKLQMILNTWEDRIVHDNDAIEKIDLDCMRIDLELLHKDLEIINSVLPRRY